MCHKTIVSFTPCGHTWPVTLPCGENEIPCDPPTEVPSPNEALPSEQHCPDCETDEVLKEYKMAVAKNPDFGKPEKEPQEEDEDASILAELKMAMEENPELGVAHEAEVNDRNADGMDPMEEYMAFLRAHPEHIAVKPTSRRDPSAPDTFYKFKEHFGCGHFGNFFMTEIERNDEDEEWLTTYNKTYCPNCNELPDAELMSPQNRMSDDPWRLGRDLGHIPGIIAFDKDGMPQVGDPDKVYAGPGMHSGAGSGYDRFGDIELPKASVLPGYEDTSAPSANSHRDEDPLNEAFAERYGQQSHGKGKGRADAEEIANIDPYHDERIQEPGSDEEYHRIKGRVGKEHDDQYGRQGYESRHYHADDRSESGYDMDDRRSDRYARSDTGAEVDFSCDDYDSGDYERGRQLSYLGPQYRRRETQNLVKADADYYGDSHGNEHGRHQPYNGSRYHGRETQKLAEADRFHYSASQDYDEYSDPGADDALPRKHQPGVETPTVDNFLGDSGEDIDRDRRALSPSTEQVSALPGEQPPMLKKGGLKALTAQLTELQPKDSDTPPPILLDMSNLAPAQRKRITDRQREEAGLSMAQARNGALSEGGGVELSKRSDQI